MRGPYFILRLVITVLLLVAGVFGMIMLKHLKKPPPQKEQEELRIQAEGIRVHSFRYSREDHQVETFHQGGYELARVQLAAYRGKLGEQYRDRIISDAEAHRLLEAGAQVTERAFYQMIFGTKDPSQP